MKKYMNVYFFIALGVGLSIAAMLFGYYPTGVDLYQKYTSGQITYQTFQTGLLEGIFSWQNALSLSLITAGLILSGFNLITLVPLGLLYIAFNLFVIPTAFLTGLGLPFPFDTILTLFFNITYIVIALAFLRG